MAVAPEMRGQGIARRLHEARFEVLGREPVEGIFIDVFVPERLTRRQPARERKVGSDPRARLRIFGRFGFCRVGIRYEQLVGGPDGGPVTDTGLLYCPRAPADTVPTALVVATLRADWSSWLGPSSMPRSWHDEQEGKGSRCSRFTRRSHAPRNSSLSLQLSRGRARSARPNEQRVWAATSSSARPGP